MLQRTMYFVAVPYLRLSVVGIYVGRLFFMYCVHTSDGRELLLLATSGDLCLYYKQYV